eukprot:989242-Amphidinium_carterae.3
MQLEEHYDGKHLWTMMKRRLLFQQLPGNGLLTREALTYILVSTKDAIEDPKKRLEKPLIMQTAFGIMEAEKRATEKVNTLRSTITPLLLESTPDVLSVGRRCMTEGYSFHWEKGENPYFIDKKGRRIDLSVERYIPYLNDVTDKATPATVHSGFLGEPEDDLMTDGTLKVTPDIQVSDPEHGEADITQTGRARNNLINEAKSLAHQMTHLPKNPCCHTCARGKATSMRSPRTSGSELYKAAKKFGDVVTVDHAIAQSKMDHGIDNEVAMVVILDIYTCWLQCYPVVTKDADEVCNALRDFADHNLSSRPCIPIMLQSSSKQHMRRLGCTREQYQESLGTTDLLSAWYVTSKRGPIACSFRQDWTPNGGRTHLSAFAMRTTYRRKMACHLGLDDG